MLKGTLEGADAGCFDADVDPAGTTELTSCAVMPSELGQSCSLFADDVEEMEVSESINEDEVEAEDIGRNGGEYVVLSDSTSS
jgi:hypothetical protein